MIDMMISKIVTWIDVFISLVARYSNILVYGALAMMVAKFVKLNVKVNAKK